VKLYIFEHCSLCFRVRMTAALKRRHLQETIVLDDDTETMMALVGKRQIPILVKDDGRAMLESMDMVRHVDSFDDPVLTGDERAEIAAWADRVPTKAAPPNVASLSAARPGGVCNRGRTRPLQSAKAKGSR
jgi:glutaredoxin 2